jgi:hypothetical protein
MPCGCEELALVNVPSALPASVSDTPKRASHCPENRSFDQPVSHSTTSRQTATSTLADLVSETEQNVHGPHMHHWLRRKRVLFSAVPPWPRKMRVVDVTDARGIL